MLERAKKVIDGGITARLHLGAQLYVSRDGATVADLALGEAREGLAMRPDTRMQWMSSIKPITAVAIAQQWERDKLELDDPVARHLPEFAAGGKDQGNAIDTKGCSDKVVASSAIFRSSFRAIGEKSRGVHAL